MKRFALFLAAFSFAVVGTVRAQGVLLLTFDDRHWTKWEAAQPIFAKYNAHVTFFPYGTLDAAALASLKRLQIAGHTVGIHTAHHKNAAPFFAKKGGDLNVAFPAKELATRRMVEGLGVGAHYKTDIEKVCALIRRLAKEDLALVIYSHDIAPEPSKIGMRMEWLEKILVTAEESGVAVRGFGELDAAKEVAETNRLFRG